MGSEGPKNVVIHVTGFKKFQGVAENPTETIVDNLKDFVDKRGLPAGVTLGSCTILETAGDGALPTLYKVLESGTAATNDDKNEQIVWLHLGVNSGALRFAIERLAANEATFLCPDELGWQPLALYLYSEMVSQEIRESPSTFSSVLSICSDSGFSREGIQVHCRVIKLGFDFNLYIGSSLVGLYMRMGLDDLALSLFGELPERNLATWNLVLRSICELGRFDDLLGLYNKMKLDNVEANGLSFCYLIRGCSDERFFNEGRQLHCHVIKVGRANSNIFVANALVDFYSACGSLNEAKKSFQAIPLEDVLSWNSILSVHADNGLFFYALDLFYTMQFWGKKPSIRSFVAFLNLSSMNGNILFGKQIHCYVLKMGFDNGSVHVQSALIDMYGKCGDIKNSVSVYESLPKTTMECCNSLMTSLLHCGIVDDVVEMFGLMVDEGVDLMGSGHVQLALQVFQQLSSPNVFCFTSIINGFARNGLGRECLEMLEAMIQKGLKPDKVTFLCVLTGCSHSGLVEEGRLVFNSMKSLHGISPDTEHFSCMVDLLGRAGLLDEAEELLQQAPERVAGSVVYNNIGMLEELERFEIDEENGVELSDTPSWTSERGRRVLVNVDSFGAVADGVSDHTQAFVKAWQTACATPKSVFLVPPGRRYLVNATKFKGPCEDGLIIQIDGTIIAPDEPKNWDPNLPRLWLDFSKLNGVLFQGNGLIDGSGRKWWKSSCKKNKSNVIYLNYSIALSVLDIGSLGKDNSTGIVTKVVLDTAFLKETANGLRIKTWQGGNGYVHGIRFENVKVEDVANPIIIDQFYCDSPKACKNQTSAVKISEIVYRNVTGTTKSAMAMKFACSDTVPCSNIVLSNINLEKKDGTVETYCNSAQGFGYGVVHPSANCLTSQDKHYFGVGVTDIAEDYVTDQTEIAELAESSSEAIVHTEL
ncbi:hypothetical protein GH714_023611 [Hevea brasiliensis]|uniref:Pectate lyase superfamily protein domain-containing protein n=1 Tax=Hevea brasiliensis TaxID=3981 RepID=A0A6A6KFK1_HEVBR|nr:hypothetical protein GH714_023611 [Hevea brasiliensis]